MDQDKRQSPRVEMAEIVEVHVLPDSRSNISASAANQSLYLKARNISQEGICLETREFFIPNQIFELDFLVPHNGTARAYASVVWSEKNACGLRFIKPGEFPSHFFQREKA